MAKPPARRAPRAAARSTRAVTGSAAPHPLVDAAQATVIFDLLDTQHPNADTELHFRNAFELLVATILSAQCTDARVNQVTPGLFATYPDAAAFAAVEPETLEPVLQPTGFFRMKARALVGMSRALVAEYRGEVPASMDALVELPGVGRKTANVVLGHALGVPGLPVDRHVLRVTNRIGLVKSDDPVAVEAASDALILHGRRVCRPTPACDRCLVRTHCAYFKALGAKVRTPRLSRRGGSSS
jgi:endonuclease-3